tara:strand:+ start:829 stop:1416 length:588 start_codon:yes stop_codon:yes gene_type:complete
MIFLKYYIEFSIIYNQKYSLYRNILINNDGSDLIKNIIWSYYKELIALDIINDFIFNYTYQCTDCFTINWKFNLKNFINNFYNSSACNIEPFDFTTTTCCKKLICSGSCYFNIICKNCTTFLYNYSLPISNDDIGWNSIEGQNNINIICYYCNHINTINLSMNNCNDDEPYTFIGKRVYNKNKYIIQNNTRIILH